MTVTTQDLFDRVVNHLLAQNCQSVATDGTCTYRGENGLKCAVGCLIDDAYYSAALEYSSPHADEVAEAIGQSIGRPITADEAALLNRLQDIHDSRPVDEWPKHLRTAANLSELEYRA